MAADRPEARGRRARTALLWLALAVTVGFGYLAVREARPEEVWDALRDSEPVWLVPALAALAVAVWLRALRWRALFAPETRPPARAVLAATLVGYFFNNVLPLRAGEAARVVALHQRSGASRAETAATVVLERLYDLAVVLALLFALLPWLPDVTWLEAAAVLAGVVLAGLLAAAAALAAFGDRPFRLLLRPASRLLAAERVDAGAASLHRGLAGLRRPRVVVEALVLTVASWLVLGLSAWLVMLSFELGLSVVAGTFAMVAAALAMVLPSSPAAVGVFEAAVLVALGAYGVGGSVALSYALVLHAVNFVPFVLAGLAILPRLRGEIVGPPRTG